MTVKEFRASPATDRLVRAYRVIHFDLATVQTPAVKVIVPAPEACLEFLVRDLSVVEYPGNARFQAECALSALHDITIKHYVPKDMMLLQIAFQPGAVRRLTGISAEALRNQYLDAGDVFGQEVRRVNSRLRDAHSYQEMVAIADAFIAGFAGRRHPGRELGVPLRLLRDNPSLSIEWLADQTSLSLRQFERCCQEYAGMPPKAFARLARFAHAYFTRLNHPDRDWLSIAVDGGYFDYQHMVRDFKHFTGHTPVGALAMQDTAPETLLGAVHEFHISYPDARQVE